MFPPPARRLIAWNRIPWSTFSEIAARADLTRAAISNYAKGDRAKNFPAPVARVTSDTPLYDWAEVASWMALNKKIPAEVAISAGVLKEANIAIAAGETHLAARLKKRAHDDEAALEAATA
jgi:hypothetical protein